MQLQRDRGIRCSQLVRRCSHRIIKRMPNTNQPSPEAICNTVIGNATNAPPMHPVGIRDTHNDANKTPTSAPATGERITAPNGRSSAANQSSTKTQNGSASARFISLSNSIDWPRLAGRRSTGRFGSCGADCSPFPRLPSLFANGLGQSVGRQLAGGGRFFRLASHAGKLKPGLFLAVMISTATDVSPASLIEPLGLTPAQRVMVWPVSLPGCKP